MANKYIKKKHIEKKYIKKRLKVEIQKGNINRKRIYNNKKI